MLGIAKNSIKLAALKGTLPVILYIKIGNTPIKNKMAQNCATRKVLPASNPNRVER